MAGFRRLFELAAYETPQAAITAIIPQSPTGPNIRLKDLKGGLSQAEYYEYAKKQQTGERRDLSKLSEAELTHIVQHSHPDSADARFAIKYLRALRRRYQDENADWNQVEVQELPMEPREAVLEIYRELPEHQRVSFANATKNTIQQLLSDKWKERFSPRLIEGLANFVMEMNNTDTVSNKVPEISPTTTGTRRARVTQPAIPPADTRPEVNIMRIYTFDTPSDKMSRTSSQKISQMSLQQINEQIARMESRLNPPASLGTFRTIRDSMTGASPSDRVGQFVRIV